MQEQEQISETTPPQDSSTSSKEGPLARGSGEPAAKEILKGAVQQNSLREKSGLLEGIFRVWFDGMVYNQIWEDPVVDAKALQLGEHSKILTISSGGCNVLNYLTYNPAAVHAVDLNPNHLRLARLRIAAVRHLPDYPALLRFFGNANTRENIALYERYIKPHLPKEEQQFWQGPLLSNRIGWFEKGLYDSSRSGYFIRFLHFLCRRAGCHPEKLLTAQSMEEQELLFEKHIGPTFDSWPVKFLGKLPVMLYSLGIPPQQFEALLEDEDDIIQLYRSRVKRLACNFPIQENYFAWQALARTYNTSEQRALPLYLQERHYHGVKSRLERITTQLTTTVQFLEHSSPRSLNAFVFLDSQDWMTSEQMTAQWSAVAAAGEQGARVIFRTAGKSSPIETALPPELRSRFQYHEQLSRELYEEDRSAVYGGFHLYELIS